MGKVTCSRCGGRGYLPCYHCDGSGVEYVYDEDEERDIPSTCPRCGGQRTIECPRCDGRGEIEDLY